MASVLIVEDDERLSRVIARLLRERGHEANTAMDVSAALRCLQQRAASMDLVLLDLGLPRVDGLALLEALGTELRYSHIPVVIYTGRDDPETRNTARKLGACDYILKGEDWTDTQNRLEHCIEIHLETPGGPAAD